jgi:hypothetical protein
MKSQLFGGLVVAMALSACGPSEVMPEPVVEGATAKVEQGISYISGYDVSVVAGTYTNQGYVMPRWNAPSNHATKDWIALAQVGSAPTSFVAWQYVNSPGLTKGVGDQLIIPTATPTNVQYEIRYFINDSPTLAAKSSPFNLKTIPSLACGSSTGYFSGDLLPTAHWVNLGATSGTVSFYFNTNSLADRVLVSTGNTVIYDSGCNVTSGWVNIPYNNANSRLRVQTLPDCGDARDPEGSYWDWSMSCPQ